jgi:hypothetical protein
MANKLIIICGAKNTGKTVAASSFLRPSEVDQVYFHDAEDSANSIVENLAKKDMGFGRYVPLTKRFEGLKDEDLLTRINAGKLPWVDARGKSSLLEYYGYVIDDLDRNLEPGRYKLYVMDTLEKFESGMVAWVDDNKRKTGAQGGPSDSAYGQFWWGALYPLYDAFFNAIYDRGVETIILTSHLKQAWSGKKPVPGKVKPSGKSILYVRSMLFLWLVNEINNPNGEPAALVFKERMCEFGVDKEHDEWDVRRMLPYRIPCFSWKRVREYMEHGADLANPAPGEARSQRENDMISEMLSDIQMQLMIAQEETEQVKAEQDAGKIVPMQQPGSFNLKRTETEQVQAPAPAPDVKAMHASGKSAEQIATETGINVNVVKVMLNA